MYFPCLFVGKLQALTKFELLLTKFEVFAMDTPGEKTDPPF